MSPRGNILIVGAALLVLVVVGIVTGTGPNSRPTPYASTSAAADGTLALYRWIAKLGYRPTRLTTGPLQPRGLGALVVLEPRVAFSRADVAALEGWVHGGGTLVLLEDGGDAALPGAFGLTVKALPGSGLAFLAQEATPFGAAPVQPLLAHPPLRGLSVTASSGVYGTVPGVIAVLGNGGMRPPGAPAHARITLPDAANPVLVYERVGQGQVFAGSIPGVVANGTIGTGENRLLMPNMLAGLPPGAAVGFDDYHLVVPPAPAAAPASLGDALTSTAWGRALLYALALAAAYVVLTGRRLGRPLRPAPERGRSLSEYVISMAATFRRAGLRTRVLALWQAGLRRELAGAAGLRGYDDERLVAEATRRADLTPREQSEALLLLRPRATLDEAALVDLCRRIARLQTRLAQT